MVEASGVLAAGWCPSRLVLGADIDSVFQYGNALVEAVGFHAELDAIQVGILEIQLSDDGTPLGLKGGVVLVVASVSFDFGEGCHVGELVDRFCQSVVGGTRSL